MQSVKLHKLNIARVIMNIHVGTKIENTCKLYIIVNGKIINNVVRNLP